MTYFHPEVGCLNPDDHYPDHHADLRFHARNPLTGGWEDMTEREMLDVMHELRMTGRGDCLGIMLASEYDFWYEDADNPWPSQLHKYFD